jgi:Vitamin K-dependent gamma-carboxylase
MFPPDWPRALASRVAKHFGGTSISSSPTCTDVTPLPRWGIALLAAYAVVQLALPLRPYLMPQPPAWTGRGFNLAWQVMIVEKTGFVEFHAVDPESGQRHRLSAKEYLTPRQEMMMAQDPQLIRDFARHLSSEMKRRGQSAVQINVNAYASLNGRPSQPMINPAVDLAGPVSPDWIVPLVR